MLPGKNTWSTLKTNRFPHPMCQCRSARETLRSGSRTTTFVFSHSESLQSLRCSGCSRAYPLTLLRANQLSSPFSLVLPHECSLKG